MMYKDNPKAGPKMTTKTIFTLYLHKALLHQVGERYCEEAMGTESQDMGVYGTEAEGLAALEALRPQLEYEVTKTRRGLDSIEFDEVELHKEIVEVDEHGYEDLLDSDVVASERGVTDEIMEAAYKAERSYWKYLDYEADEYHGIEL